MNPHSQLLDQLAIVSIIGSLLFRFSHSPLIDGFLKHLRRLHIPHQCSVGSPLHIAFPIYHLNRILYRYSQGGSAKTNTVRYGSLNILRGNQRPGAVMNGEIVSPLRRPLFLEIPTADGFSRLIRPTTACGHRKSVQFPAFLPVLPFGIRVRSPEYNPYSQRPAGFLQSQAFPLNLAAACFFGFPIRVEPPAATIKAVTNDFIFPLLEVQKSQKKRTLSWLF